MDEPDGTVSKRALFHRALSVLRRTPLTIVIFTSILIAGIATQTFARNIWPTLMQMFGWYLPALKAGKLYAPWVGLLFGSRPGHFETILGIGVLGIGALEYRQGTKWAAIGFLLLGPIITVVDTLLLWPLDTLGIAWVRPYLYQPDMGSSAASIVCWGLFLGLEGRWWKKLLVAGTIFTLAFFWIFIHEAWNLDHTTGFLMGLVIGIIIQRRRLKLAARENPAINIS
jgi:hypothetical protein